MARAFISGTRTGSPSSATPSSGTRDGIYIQSSTHGIVRRNRASDLRYGLHYMFADDNVFEDNMFENSAAGTALMYSRRITFRRNRFLRNRGFASVGLLFKTCDEVVAEDNLDRRQRTRRLPRRVVPAIGSGETSSPCPIRPSCSTTRATTTSSKATRFLRTSRPFAGGPTHGHAIRRQLLVGPAARRPR